MVMAIFVLVILTGMAVALLFLSQNEVKMSTASLRTKQVFYTAEAAVEDGRMTLFATNGGDSFNDDLLAAAGANGNIDFNPASVQPVYDADGNPSGFTGYGDDVPLTAATGLGDHLYAAFLTNDPDESSPGVLNLADTNDRVMITGVGAGPGNSFEVVQAIIELDLLFPALPPSTITFVGPRPFLDGGMSKAKEYVGDDCKGAGIPGLYVPAIGVTDPSSVDPCAVGAPDPSSVLCGIYAPTTYYTGPYTGRDTAADVTDPGVYGGAGPIHPSYLDCWFLHDLVDRVREAADVICPEGQASDCALPPSDPSRVIFVDGDFFIGAWDDGEGMVFATGELWFHGDSAWVGTAWAVGEGVMWRYGGGTETIMGSVFVADIAGPDDTYGTADDCTGGVNGFGEGVYNAQGGGSGDIVYCSNVILDSMPPAPYSVVDFLQR
jgi:hypothetical protein